MYFIESGIATMVIIVLLFIWRFKIYKDKKENKDSKKFYKREYIAELLMRIAFYAQGAYMVSIGYSIFTDLVKDVTGIGFYSIAIGIVLGELCIFTGLSRTLDYIELKDVAVDGLNQISEKIGIKNEEEK